MSKKKVFVSGCFDLLHSGHIAFFEEAASYGDVYVGLGSDKTIRNLKNRKTAYQENERLYMIRALRYVKDAWINKGSGNLDFLDEIRKLKPDVFFVNEDGDSNGKRQLCSELGIDYIVSKRIPGEQLPARSTSQIISKSIIPYRLDLAGGWLDQPFVSKHYPGPVVTISIQPDREFKNRSGMSTSTRNKAIEIWGYSLPDDDPEKLAKILFSFENPPGKKEISGSQDSIGIVYPGLNKLNYFGKYWPGTIDSCLDDNILTWLEARLHFISLSPRKEEYDVLSGINISKAYAEDLSMSASQLWEAILNLNAQELGEYTRRSFEAQVKMFPNMVNENIFRQIDKYSSRALGWKLSGAGGGGYLVLVSENEIPGAFRIRIRR